jgi:F-box protein 21
MVEWNGAALARRCPVSVGCVVRHKKYGYIGAIVGWDGSCAQSQEWIDMMGIDKLANGRHQVRQ